MRPVSDDYEQLRKELRRRRKELHLTQEQLAEMISTSPTHIGRVERGQSIPGRDLLIRWCFTLSVSLDRAFLNEAGLDPRTILLLRKMQGLDDRQQEIIWRVVELLQR